jgi:hypothetical protein
MTEDRELQVKKDLLWDYQHGQSKLEVFRVEFREASEVYSHLAELFRDRPETFSPDLAILIAELERLATMAKEYKDLLEKNEERRFSLINMRVL